MKVPQGLQVRSPKLVYKLNISICDLKQAFRQWFGKLFNALLAYGFRLSVSDNSLFIMHKDKI